MRSCRSRTNGRRPRSDVRSAIDNGTNSGGTWRNRGARPPAGADRTPAVHQCRHRREAAANALRPGGYPSVQRETEAGDATPSIWKDPKSPYWQADIWICGHKFCRSTRCKNERDARTAAERIEKELRESLADQGEILASLTLDYIAERWMRDIGDHHRGEGPKIDEGKIAKLISYFGKDRSLADITHDDVLKLVNWRRKHTVGKGGKGRDGKDRKKPRPISAYTVNDTTEQLKKLFTYCKQRKVKFQNEPDWSDEQLWLREPEERARFLSGAEQDRLDDALGEVRDDCAPLIEFSWVSGKRATICRTLEWSHVHWDRGVIEREGKRGKIVSVAITDTIREILWPLRGHHPVYVFTFEAKRTVDKLIKGKRHKFTKGERYRVTKDGLRRVWNTVRKLAGLPTEGLDRFRYHDLRHDFATGLLKMVKEKTPAAALKVVQEALMGTRTKSRIGCRFSISPTTFKRPL